MAIHPWYREKRPERSIPQDRNVRCFVCLGHIKETAGFVLCVCGRYYHEPCAKRIKSCPMCGHEVSIYSAIHPFHIPEKEEVTIGDLCQFVWPTPSSWMGERHWPGSERRVFGVVMEIGPGPETEDWAGYRDDTIWTIGEPTEEEAIRSYENYLEGVRTPRPLDPDMHGPYEVIFIKNINRPRKNAVHPLFLDLRKRDSMFPDIPKKIGECIEADNPTLGEIVPVKAWFEGLKNDNWEEFEEIAWKASKEDRDILLQIWAKWDDLSVIEQIAVAWWMYKKYHAVSAIHPLFVRIPCPLAEAEIQRLRDLLSVGPLRWDESVDPGLRQKGLLDDYEVGEEPEWSAARPNYDILGPQGKHPFYAENGKVSSVWLREGVVACPACGSPIERGCWTCGRKLDPESVGCWWGEHFCSDECFEKRRPDAAIHPWQLSRQEVEICERCGDSALLKDMYTCVGCDHNYCLFCWFETSNPCNGCMQTLCTPCYYGDSHQCDLKAVSAIHPYFLYTLNKEGALNKEGTKYSAEEFKAGDLISFTVPGHRDRRWYEVVVTIKVWVNEANFISCETWTDMEEYYNSPPHLRSALVSDNYGDRYSNSSIALETAERRWIDVRLHGRMPVDEWSALHPYLVRPPPWEFFTPDDMEGVCDSCGREINPASLKYALCNLCGSAICPECYRKKDYPRMYRCYLCERNIGHWCCDEHITTCDRCGANYCRDHWDGRIQFCLKCTRKEGRYIFYCNTCFKEHRCGD